MLRAKVYDMAPGFQDIVATFPKTECRISDKPNPDEKKESYWNELEQDRKMTLNQERSVQRAKTRIRRLCITYDMRYMWTFSFRSKRLEEVDSKGRTHVYDTGDLNDVWKVWKAFLKRCSRAGVTFNYICTIEVQEKRLEKYGEKVYHFHFATNHNIPKNRKLAKRRGWKVCMDDLWTYGMSYVTRKKSKKKFANQYLTKYVTKMFEETSKGSNRYRVSNSMKVPVEEVYFYSEAELDLYVARQANVYNCRMFKEYFPINDGHQEVLFYGLTPF